MTIKTKFLIVIIQSFKALIMGNFSIKSRENSVINSRVPIPSLRVCAHAWPALFPLPHYFETKKNHKNIFVILP